MGLQFDAKLPDTPVLQPDHQQRPAYYFGNKRSEEGPGKPHTAKAFVAALPCDPFLRAFLDESAFASTLNDKAKALAKEWQDVNKGVKASQRTMVERHYTLLQTCYNGMRGELETAEYEMQLSTWGFTKKARLVDECDPIGIKDIKVICLRAIAGPNFIKKIFFYF